MLNELQRDEFNQILLTTKDGRQLSIVQNGMLGQTKGKFCEVWIDGDENPVTHLNAEDLVKFLQEKV
tara:strand:+ start:318 stop:518 length:201 start_codon:yes stop_codon:yes gene_type:complete